MKMVSNHSSDSKGRFRPESSRLEWVGGYGRTPFTIHDREEPYRGVVVFWLELPVGVVAGTRVVHPEEIGTALGETLITALEAPLVGSPRRPDIIRVADTDLADEVLAVTENTIPVMIAPTPEIADILNTMLKDMENKDIGPDSERVPMTYLNEGHIPAGLMRDLFQAAQILYGLKPWETADDSQVIRMDIPSLGIEGACVCIIGQLGENLGVMFFSSLEDYQSFTMIAMYPDDAEKFPEFEAGWLALDFVEERDLPESMLKEVADHDWPLPDDGLYPVPLNYDPDGVPVPCSAHETKVIAAGTSALAAFWLKHKNLFTQDRIHPVCESFFDRDDLEVCFTFPFDAYDEFDVNSARLTEAVSEAQRRLSETGRNDPCPCGSGKKYKRCHLRADEEVVSGEITAITRKSREDILIDLLMGYADHRFESAYWDHTKDFDDPQDAMQLAIPWSVFGFPVEGTTVLEHFLEESGRPRDPWEREFMDAQCEAWLSVWEVVDVEPGESITLEDQLTGEIRRVRDGTASRSLIVRDTVLARVIGLSDEYYFSGLHPRPLPPLEAAEVVRLARQRLRRRRTVPVDRVRAGEFGRYLIRKWEDQVERMELARSIPPQLSNTDGDPLLLTRDHFEFEAADRRRVADILMGMEDVLPPENNSGDQEFVFLQQGTEPDLQNTIIGMAMLKRSSLRLTTNSVARADALRSRVQKACGDLIRHQLREHSDPMSLGARKPSLPDSSFLDTEETRALTLDFKRRHYATWPDQPLPALRDGRHDRPSARLRVAAMWRF